MSRLLFWARPEESLEPAVVEYWTHRTAMPQSCHSGTRFLHDCNRKDWM